MKTGIKNYSSINAKVIGKNIAAKKRNIQLAENRVRELLKNNYAALTRFNRAMDERKKTLMKTSTGLSATEPEEDKSWYDSALFKDLLSFGTDVLASDREAANQRKILEVELAQIQAQNSALDKQIALRNQLTASDKAKAYSVSFVDELANSPVKLGALGLLGYLLLKRL